MTVDEKAFTAALIAASTSANEYQVRAILEAYEAAKQPVPASGTVSITTNGTTRIIPADEPVFLIRGQDVVGGITVRAWADFAEAHGASPDIVAAAREHAVKMAAWPKKKVADLPEPEEGR